MGKETPRGLCEEDISTGNVVVQDVGEEVKSAKPKDLIVVNLEEMDDQKLEMYIYGYRPKGNRYSEEV